MEINFTGNSATGYDNTPQAQRKPLSMGGEIQANAQRMNPFKPNNGNPRGANNMPSYENVRRGMENNPLTPSRAAPESGYIDGQNYRRPTGSGLMSNIARWGMDGGGADNFANYNNAVGQGAKPMPGGYQQGPSQQPPMPAYNGVPSNMYTGDPEVDSIIRYNLSTQRDRFDPSYGIMQSDSATAEDRALMGLPGNAYQNMYTPDGRMRFDQLLQGRNPSQGQMSNQTYQDMQRMLLEDPRASQEAMNNLFQGFRGDFGSGGQGSSGSGGNYQPSPQGYWDQGQNPQWGRYVPPMMRDYRNPTDWYYQGGYNYNLPGAAGQFPTLGGFLTPPRPNFTTPRVDYPGG